MKYQIAFSCVSHIGKCRKMNQDNFICNGQYLEQDSQAKEVWLKGVVPVKSPQIFGVFDGMGGEECGEVASFLAARQATMGVIAKRTKDVEADIKRYCLDANAAICNYAKEHSIVCMGTTAAMLVFDKSEIVLCNIGDSKIFRFAEHKIEQISQDHLAISPYGTKPSLSQHLGITPEEMLIEPYIAHGQYNKGDIYLLCSDGLTDMVEVSDIENIIEYSGLERVTSVLLEQALAHGGKDNITILVCKIESKDRIWKKIMKRLLKKSL